MGKSRSHRNRNAKRQTYQRNGNVACIARNRSEPISRLPPNDLPRNGVQAAGVPLREAEELLVNTGLTRVGRGPTGQEVAKSDIVGALPQDCLSAADNIPLPPSRALALPRAQWVVTLRGWVDRIANRMRRTPADQPVQISASQLQKLRRELAATQRLLDGVISGMTR